MLRSLSAAVAFVAWSAATASVAAADNAPVVVELFTSQGCSSCPPADALLAEIAGRDDVIALALHVDYWDYLGWKDTFADPAFTRRQEGYAATAGATTIYTPQMVVGGVDHLVGVRPMDLADLIAAHKARPAPVALGLAREGDRVRIAAQADAQLPAGTTVQLVRYRPEAAVEIARGENAGRRLAYTHVVEAWSPLAEWDGREPLALDADAPGDAAIAVIVQAPGPGPILGAAALR